MNSIFNLVIIVILTLVFSNFLIDNPEVLESINSFISSFLSLENSNQESL